MGDRRERTVGETINTWVQTIGIILAGAWAAYTFVYKEIIVPESAPVNISLHLQLKNVGKRESKSSLAAIEMQVSASNPSSRTVHLLPSVWIAYGCKSSRPTHDSSFKKRAEKAIGFNGETEADLYAVSKADVVALGRLFADDTIQPHETISRSVIFYIPVGQYDSVVASVLMPTSTAANRVELDWSLGKNDEPMPTMYRVSAAGRRQKMKRDLHGEYSDGSIGLWEGYSHTELSLWR